MNRDQQDLAWASLPKKVRKEIQSLYSLDTESNLFQDGFIHALEEIYGHHNLTSDTEPAEMLCIPRWEIMCKENTYTRWTGRGLYEAAYIHGKLDLLHELFGDKCLPDKELNEDNFAKSEPSVQVEPQFKIGDKVKINNVVNPMMQDVIGIIEELPTADESRYKVRYEEDHWSLLDADYLEPYTEPESRNLSQETANCDKIRR